WASPFRRKKSKSLEPPQGPERANGGSSGCYSSTPCTSKGAALGWGALWRPRCAPEHSTTRTRGSAGCPGSPERYPLPKATFSPRTTGRTSPTPTRPAFRRTTTVTCRCGRHRSWRRRTGAPTSTTGTTRPTPTWKTSSTRRLPRTRTTGITPRTAAPTTAAKTTTTTTGTTAAAREPRCIVDRSIRSTCSSERRSNRF
ncbi:unnamed protein product, partial [Ixodes hexagonus]